VLTLLQGCKLLGDAAGGYLLSFGGLLAVSLAIQDAGNAAAAEGGSSSSGQVVRGSLVMLPREVGAAAGPAAAAAAGAPAEGALKLQLLQDFGEDEALSAGLSCFLVFVYCLFCLASCFRLCWAANMRMLSVKPP
jgi:hypothetical protein